MKNISPTLLLFNATLSLACGIWISSLHTPPILSLLFIATSILCFLRILYCHAKWAAIKTACISILFFCVGGTIYKKTVNTQSKFLAALQKKDVLLGSITEVATVAHSHAKQHITVKLFLTDKHYKWLPLFGSIMVYTDEKRHFQADDIIEIKNVRLQKPSQSSFSLHLLRKGIYAICFCASSSITLAKRPLHSFARSLDEWRSKVFLQLKNKLSKRSFALMSALFLGNKSFNKYDTNPLNILFKRWGIAHIYARSGLHLALLVWVCLTLLQCVPAPYTLKSGFIAALVCLYALLSWSSISFLRACIVFFLCSSFKITRTPYRIFHTVLVTCFITLITNPIHLFFLDFQLSFGLTLALAFTNHIRTPSKKG